MTWTDQLLDTSGDRPSIKWGSLLGVLGGSILFTWIYWSIELIRLPIDMARSWTAAAIATVQDVTGELFATDPIDSAIAANLEFLAGFGLAAPLIAVLQVTLGAFLVAWIADRLSGGYFSGVIG